MVEKNSKKKNLKGWTEWNRKMGGRSFIVTSGAFGDTLLCGSRQDLQGVIVMGTQQLLECRATGKGQMNTTPKKEGDVQSPLIEPEIGFSIIVLNAEYLYYNC